MVKAHTEVVIQVLFYTRAAASDYDDWENVYGNKGWSSEYLVPLLKKVRASTSTYLPRN
jgi:choline dehydrogenase-like flavoprotein